MMRLLQESGGKTCNRKYEVRLNRRITFLSLLWEDYHRLPSFRSLIPYSVRNLFAETAALACTGRPANAKLYQYLKIYWVPKLSLSRWIVYLFVIFMYSALVTLPSNYRDHMFVSPFLRHLCVLLQWTNAICPCVGLLSSLSVKFNPHMKKRQDSQNYCSQTITV